MMTAGMTNGGTDRSEKRSAITIEGDIQMMRHSYPLRLLDLPYSGNICTNF